MKRGKIQKEDVLVVKDGATTGKVSLVGGDFPYEDAAINEHVFILRGKKDLVHQKFLFYHLFSPIGQRQMDANFHGAAIGGINTQFVKNYNMFLPPLPTQKKIAAVLEKAEETKKFRAQADELTDRLIQSVFLEMFGNPVRNPKGWKKVLFNKVCQTRLGKMLDKKKQTGYQCKPYLRNANVQWNKFDLSSVFEMDFDETECAEFLLRKGDILICEGGEIGRAAIWNNELPECYFQKALHRARPFPDSAIPEFIVNLMLILGKCNGFRNFTSQSTIAHLTGVKLHSFPIILPPLPLQQKFARIFEKIESMRQSQNQSKQHIEDLFSTLMQKAFRGEL